MAKKLLLIDDDLTLIRLLKRYLDNAGYEVESATSGLDGLRTMYQFQPDLVVLDVMMPGMDGWETCKRIREISEVPVIMLTAKDTEADKIKGFRGGVDDYVTKPFSFAEFAARVGAVLQRAGRRPGVRKPQLYVSGELVVDVDARKVILSGSSIELTPTEFRLLAILAENKGKPVSKAALLSKVWGAEFVSEVGYVKRYIWNLRQKIEEDPLKPRYIVTERGYGYRLEGDSLSEPEDDDEL